MVLDSVAFNTDELEKEIIRPNTTQPLTKKIRNVSCDWAVQGFK